jgi:hypothetical protein
VIKEMSTEWHTWFKLKYGWPQRGCSHTIMPSHTGQCLSWKSHHAWWCGATALSWYWTIWFLQDTAMAKLLVQQKITKHEMWCFLNQCILVTSNMKFLFRLLTCTKNWWKGVTSRDAVEMQMHGRNLSNNSVCVCVCVCLYWLHLHWFHQ